MTVLSLFDGISCGQLALKKAGIKVDRYYASEIDKFAIQVAQKNFPETVQLGDVTKLTEEDLKSLGHIDLLIGGSPCQSLSITQSKTRQGLDGKSKLFFEFVRVLETVKPDHFLFENVASMSAECKYVITNCLNYTPVFIDSADFSAQSRPRYYWTDIPVDLDYEINKDVLADIMEENVDEKYFYKCDFDFHGYDETVAATLHIKGHDILKRVLSPIHKCHTLTCCHGGNHQKKVLSKGRPRKLTPVEYERLQTLPDGYTDCLSDSQRYNVIGNGWTVSVITHILRGLK